MSESQLQTKVIKWLKAMDIYHFKTIVTNRAGTPDIIGCVNGQFFALELKAPDKDCDKSMSALQKRNIRLIKKSGGLGFCSNNLEEIKFKIGELL